MWANRRVCPPGSKSGGFISPSGGFTSNTFANPAGIVLDQQNNAWISNSTSPGSITELLGSDPFASINFVGGDLHFPGQSFHRWRGQCLGGQYNWIVGSRRISGQRNRDSSRQPRRAYRLSKYGTHAEESRNRRRGKCLDSQYRSLGQSARRHNRVSWGCRAGRHSSSRSTLVSWTSGSMSIRDCPKLSGSTRHRPSGR